MSKFVCFKTSENQIYSPKTFASQTDEPNFELLFEDQEKKEQDFRQQIPELEQR